MINRISWWPNTLPIFDLSMSTTTPSNFLVSAMPKDWRNLGHTKLNPSHVIAQKFTKFLKKVSFVCTWYQCGLWHGRRLQVRWVQHVWTSTSCSNSPPFRVFPARKQRSAKSRDSSALPTRVAQAKPLYWIWYKLLCSLRITVSKHSAGAAWPDTQRRGNAPQKSRIIDRRNFLHNSSLYSDNKGHI